MRGKNKRRLRSLQNSKRGAAHFEMIISIIFFVGFVGFLFLVMPPTETTTLSNAVIVGLYDSFEEKTLTNLSNMFLKANYTGPGVSPCFYINLSSNIFTYEITDGNSRVTRLGGQDADSNLVGDNLNINKDDIFFRVAISPELTEEGITGCDSLENYTLGSIIERQVVSYSSLETMQNDYSNDYETLKGELGIPPIFDFGILTETINITMQPQSGIPTSVEVMAEDYILEVLKSDGTLINERFTLKIW